MAATTSINNNNNYRRFLFWLRYDGSRFVSMAKNPAGNKGIGVYKLFESCLGHLLGESNMARVQTYTISRTDARVHAIRNPIMIYTPANCIWFNQSDESRAKFLADFNDLINRAGFGQAMELLDIDPVAQGFHPNEHVAYRRYVYRLRRARTEDAFARSSCPEKHTLTELTEYNYSWTVPPYFSLEKAEEICQQLRQPGLNFASFFHHKLGERVQGKNYKSTTLRRHLRLLQISKGEPYSVPDDSADYFNLEFVAHGFIREQIRRMVSLIVYSATGWTRDDPKRLVKFLLRDPDPKKFHHAKLKAAPPSGLFLANVVFDPRMFSNPIPIYTTKWDLLDLDSPAAADETAIEEEDEEEEMEEEQDVEDFDDETKLQEMRIMKRRKWLEKQKLRKCTNTTRISNDR